MTGPQDPAAGGDRFMAGHADGEQAIDIVQQGRPAASARRRPLAQARRRPLVRAAAGSGGCLAVAFAAMRFFEFAEPGGPNPASYHSWTFPCLFVAVAAVVAALFILGYGVGASVEQRRSRKELAARAGRAPRNARTAPGAV